MAIIEGTTGDDVLTGGAEADELFGGPGADLLDGGGGAVDELFGGPGADLFVVAASAGADIRINDFEGGVDLIRAENFAFADFDTDGSGTLEDSDTGVVARDGGLSLGFPDLDPTLYPTGQVFIAGVSQLSEADFVIIA